MDLEVPTHAQKLIQYGIEQGKKEVALKMLIKSMSIQDIADITGFTEDEIRAIDEARKKAQQNS